MRRAWGGGGINLYDYVKNNPVSFIDPIGLCPGDITIFIGINVNIFIPGAIGGTDQFGLYFGPEGMGFYNTPGAGSGMDMSLGPTVGINRGTVADFEGRFNTVNAGAGIYSVSIMQNDSTGAWTGFAGGVGVGLTPISGSADISNTSITKPVAPDSVPFYSFGFYR